MGALLNVRHEKYARARALMGLTREQAYLHAGYTGNPKTQVDKVAGHPDVKARITELQTSVEDKLTTEVVNTEKIGKEWVMTQLMENIEASKQHKPIIFEGMIVYKRDHEGRLLLDKNGNPQPLYQRDARSINEALKLIGMEFDMFQIKQQIDVRRDHFKGLTLDEIKLELQNRLEIDFGFVVPVDQIDKMLRGEVPDDPRLQTVTIEAEHASGE